MMQDFLNTTFRTVSWFRAHRDEGTLRLRPLFQRNPVWTDSQKSYLIDSVLSGYPIPELYMQEIIDAAGVETQIVVDGQQRIRACMDFIAGDFEINTKLDPPSKWHDLSFNDLSDDLKKKLFSYRFVVRILPEMPEETLREIFKRLNRVVESLNDQELRHATYWGDFIRTVETLADLPFWANSGLFSAQSIRRMSDVEFVSEIVIAVLHGPQNKKDTVEQWYQMYESKGFEEHQVLDEVFRKVLLEIEQVAPLERGLRWRKKSDFYTLFLLLAKNHAKLPLASDLRERLQALLKYVSKAVDFYLTARDSQDAANQKAVEELPQWVKDYAKGVERAASDIANRKARMTALETALTDVFPLPADGSREFTGISGTRAGPPAAPAGNAPLFQVPDADEDNS